MSKSADSGIVHITNLHPIIPISHKKVRLLVQKVFQSLHLKREVHLTFVSDSRIKRINQLFHGTNAATDVLAFGSPSRWLSCKSSKGFLGEVIISIDRAIVYSKQFDVTPDEELFRYVVHGLLHLLGERDHSAALREKMFRKQEAILRGLQPIVSLIKRK